MCDVILLISYIIYILSYIYYWKFRLSEMRKDMDIIYGGNMSKIAELKEGDD